MWITSCPQLKNWMWLDKFWEKWNFSFSLRKIASQLTCFENLTVTFCIDLPPLVKLIELKLLQTDRNERQMNFLSLLRKTVVSLKSSTARGVERNFSRFDFQFFYGKFQKFQDIFFLKPWKTPNKLNFLSCDRFVLIGYAPVARENSGPPL